MDYRSFVEMSAAGIAGHMLKYLQQGLQVICCSICSMDYRSLAEMFSAGITGHWL